MFINSSFVFIFVFSLSSSPLRIEIEIEIEIENSSITSIMKFYMRIDVDTEIASGIGQTSNDTQPNPKS